MNASRRQVVLEAFSKVDRSGDGVLTIEDLKGVYNVKRHPQYLNGEATEEDILRKFLRNFEGSGGEAGDGRVGSGIIWSRI